MKLGYCVFVILLVDVSLGSIYESAFSEILKQTSSILQYSGDRERRDVNQDVKKEIEWFLQNDDVFCFCGENWINLFANSNLEKVANCVRKAKLDVAVKEGIDNAFSKATKIIIASQCAYECIMEDLNLIDSKGYINKTLPSFFMDKVFVENKIKDVGKKAIETCVSGVSKFQMVVDMILKLGQLSSCTNHGYKFISCLLFEVTAACPTELKREDVPQCKKIYNQLEIVQMASKYMNEV
uniref:Uncharacterized protein n=1 Tax=Clastoptera arizonana TaxID=38151 RepID=A0A1B6E726_9HEMI